MSTAAPAAPELPAFLEDWSFTPAVSGDAVSFTSAAALATDDAPVFRMDLPTGAGARATLDAAENRLHRTEKILDHVEDELDALLQAVRAGAVSFDTTASPANAELLALLERPEMTSFELFASHQEKLERASAGFQHVLQWLSEMISRKPMIMTRYQGRLVGRTRVGVDGDFESHFPDQTSPEEISLHQRTVELALASRRLAIRMIVRTAQGAAKIAAYLSIPGGILLALPAAWKYIQSMLNEMNTYHELQSKGDDQHG
jgi:hypothetical protein